MNKFLAIRISILFVGVCLIALGQWGSYFLRVQRHNYNQGQLKEENSHSKTTQGKRLLLSVVNATQKPEDKVIFNSLSETLRTVSFYQTTFNMTHPSLKKRHYERVAFLKTHKTGSSTAQNIFLRYGESRNFTFLLSKHRQGHFDNVIGLQTTLNNENTLPPPPNKTFDILCCHVLYNREAFQRYMPNDTAYIGIIREPFEQFQSTLNYFRNGHIFKNNAKQEFKVLEYLRNPLAYEKGIKPYWSLTNNRMAVEFGFPLNLFNQYSKEESMKYLEKLDQEFNLVIILEYFAESVVLMRRLLGWTTKDILYVKKNAAKKEYSFADSTHRYMYERYAKLEYDMYNYFYHKLWKQILEEGVDFQMELLYFRRLRNEVEDYCKYNTTKVASYKIPSSKWSEACEITKKDCRYLQMFELTFIKEIRKRQYG